MELTGQVVPLGGILYGSGILVLEVMTRMLWALAQRQKEIDRAHRMGREEVLRDLLERGVALPPDVLKGVEEHEPG